MSVKLTNMNVDLLNNTTQLSFGGEIGRRQFATLALFVPLPETAGDSGQPMESAALDAARDVLQQALAAIPSRDDEDPEAVEFSDLEAFT